MKVFANRLKNLREHQKEIDPKFTQAHVAEILGVARPTYTAYENGTKQPPMETVAKIAKLFETSVDYLYGITDNRKHKITNDEKEMIEFFSNPELNLFFKEMKESPEEQLEELRAIWEIIKKRNANK
ncbi:XRE family transcriptional regulator [Bacillaceae bacterium SAOS 7]|nr:XRE family transcriptional regulator [Bacillaceae bacterium SAOS 7]